MGNLFRSRDHPRWWYQRSSGISEEKFGVSDEMFGISDEMSGISEEIVSSQAGLRVDGAGESALPAEEASSAGSANSENSTR